MTISYENKFRDLVAFNFHNINRSPVSLIIRVLLLGLIAASAYSLSPKEESIAVRLIVALVAGVLMGLFFFAMDALLAFLTVISTKNRTLMTRHTLTFTDDLLIEETQYNRSETKWAAVQKVLRKRNYQYIYLAQYAAHVIPRRAVSDPDWDMIYEFCKRKATENKPAPRAP